MRMICASKDRHDHHHDRKHDHLLAGRVLEERRQVGRRRDPQDREQHDRHEGQDPRRHAAFR
jgi:hypothetical protein